jgi:hypothetical protein
MDETELRSFLAGIYGTIRQIRVGQFAVQKMASATRLALKEVPGFEDEYAKQWDALSQQLDHQQDVALHEIDELIRRLGY